MNDNITIVSESRTESRAIYTALMSVGISFIIGAFIFMASGNVPLFARGISLGAISAIAGGLVSLIVYMFVAFGQMPILEKSTKWTRASRVIDTVSISLVMGMLVFLSYALVFYVIGQAFRGVALDMWASSVLLSLSVGLSTYVTYLMAVDMNTMRVSAILALFLISGTLISMMTASDPYWWDTHFSSLGAGGGVSGYAFNVTLIIAGLVIAALSKYITDDFTRLQQQGRIPKKAKAAFIQVLLTGIGVALALVGLFVYDAYPLIHNTAAFGMAVLFGVMIAMLPWLVPGFLPAFFVASYGLVGALFVSAWLFWGVNYFNLTAFELMSAAIIFTWLVLFVRHIAAMLIDESRHVPRIKEKKV